MKCSRTLGGDIQTRHTVEVMRQLTNAALFNPAIVAAAVDAVRETDGRDTVQLAKNLHAHCSRVLSFLPDPLIDGDVLRPPAYLLKEITRHGSARADCDDAAMFTAALAKAIGLTARFVVLAFGRGYEHVFTQVKTARGWFDLDVTEPPGRRVPHSRAMLVAV